MDRRYRIRVAIVRGEEIGPIGVPHPPGGDVAEHEFVPQGGDQRAAIYEAVGDGVAATWPMRILQDRIGRPDRAAGQGVRDVDWDCVVSRDRPRFFERPRLRAFAQRPAVVGPLADDDYRFPGQQADVEREQPRLPGLHRIDVPDQPVRVAQAEGPDFLAGSLGGRKGIVVGNPVAAVVADRARLRVFAQVGHDAQDLADQGIEPLRVDVAAIALVARSRIAGAQIHHPPIGSAGPRDGVEGQLAQRVFAATDAALGAARAPCPRTSRWPGCGQSIRSARPRARFGPRSWASAPPAWSCIRQDRGWDDARLRRWPAGTIRVFHVQCVEDAVARVVGVEHEVGEARGEVALERELLEEAGPASQAIEIQVDSELPGCLSKM